MNRSPRKLERPPHKIADGRIGAAGTGGAFNAAGWNQAWMDYQSFNTDAARAAFADKWIRLASGQFNRAWGMVYELLRIIRDHKFYEDARYMEDKKARTSFEEYFAEVMQKPFETWCKLEDTYRFVQDYAPHLFEKTFAEAAAKVQEMANNPQPIKTPQEAGAMGGRGNKAIRDTNGFGSSDTADYRVARIARERPDILERMKAGEFKSVRAAALEAGIVKPTITILVDVQGFARAILRHFTPEQREELKRLI
jgi:hypothetical protein